MLTPDGGAGRRGRKPFCDWNLMTSSQTPSCGGRKRAKPFTTQLMKENLLTVYYPIEGESLIPHIVTAKY